ncbi:BapA/Bap/LapF family large adhesin [Acinetobacter indicus]|uniref:BapA/Bap/LapF family large adhesin n=1 Tax=Acinetobacter indicus TaxID=756892 RepID=UPI003989711E
MGDLNHTTVKYASVSNVAVVDIGLINNDVAGANFTTVQHAEENTDVIVTVSQQNLLAVASGFSVEVVRVEADGSLTTVKVATVNDGLVADALGLSILGVVDDGNTVAIKLEDLPEGDYRVIVKNDESVINDLIGGLTLNELGDQGVVLGKDNQELVLNTVETALNGKYGLGLGTAVKTLLSGLLATTDTLGAGDIVRALKESTIVGPLLNTLLGGLVDPILDVIADALVDNLISVLRTTNVEISGEESHFSKLSITDNVLDNDVDPSDTAVVTSVNGTAVTAEGVNIEGLYGTLTIQANGQYTYTAHDSLSSTGKVETFTYSISDGVNSDTAKLVINIKDGIAPDAAIVDPVNGSSDITGTAEPGSTVIVTFPDGTQPASASVVVGADGTWTIANPGLQDASEIIVTVKDSFGNTSEPTTIVVDALAPDAPMAHFSEAGDTVSGTAEAGSTVVVKDSGNNILGTTTVGADGKYQLDGISPALVNGETVTVTATDKAGNTSSATTIEAPLNDPSLENTNVIAEDNVMALTATVTPQTKPIEAAHWESTKLLDLQLLGPVLDTTTEGVLYASVAEDTIRDLTINASVGGVSLVSNYNLYIYKLNEAGSYVRMDEYTEIDWMQTSLVSWSDSNSKQVTLGEGSYAILLVTQQSLVGLGLFPSKTLDITGVERSYDDVTVTAQQSGNVIADVDATNGEDTVTPDTVVKSVNGINIAENLNSTLPNTSTSAAKIAGQYGDLYITADGSYVYVLDPTRAGKEQLGLAQETFTYRLVDTVTGDWSTAELSFKLDSVNAVNDVNSAGYTATNVVTENVNFMTPVNAVAATKVSSGLSNTDYEYKQTLSFNVASDKVGEDVQLKVVGDSLLTSGTYTLTYVLKNGSQTIASVTNETKQGVDTEFTKLLTNLGAGSYTLEVTLHKTTAIATSAAFDISISLIGKEIDLDSFKDTVKTTDGNILTGAEGADDLGSSDTYFAIKGKFDTNPYILYQAENQGPAEVTVQGQYGVLTIEKDGQYSYVPNGTGYGQEVFEYTLHSPTGNSSDATLTINVAKDFTGSVYNDLVTSTGGNDTISTGAGSDTLIFKVLTATGVVDPTGGNGLDTWDDFHVGNTASDTAADKIDVSALLAGQTITDINKFVSVTYDADKDTATISIDRDGDGTTYTSTELLVLTNQTTQVTLDELIQNGQFKYNV